MAVESFLTRLVTRSLTLLSRLVVRPIAFDSLDSRDDEWRVAGKLNFLNPGARMGLIKVVGGAHSSGDVKITSGVKIARVGFVIISLIVCFCN